MRHTFSQKLASALQAKKWGARTLARGIVDYTGGPQHGEDRKRAVEGFRRAIIRWLQGATAEPANRHLVEDVLGLERDALRSDDEEDEDLMAVLQTSLEDVRQLFLRELTARR